MTEERNGDSVKKKTRVTSNQPKSTRAGGKKTGKKAAAKKKTTAKKKTAKKTAKKASSSRPRRKTSATKAKAESTTTTQAMGLPVANAASDSPMTMAPDDLVVMDLDMLPAMGDSEADNQEAETAESWDTAVALAEPPDEDMSDEDMAADETIGVEEAEGIARETEAVMSSLFAQMPDDIKPAVAESSVQDPDDQSVEEMAAATVRTSEQAAAETVTITPAPTPTPTAYNSSEPQPMTFGQFAFPFLFGVGMGMLVGLAF